jgi:hypothetical protein
VNSTSAWERDVDGRVLFDDVGAGKFSASPSKATLIVCHALGEPAVPTG